MGCRIQAGLSRDCKHCGINAYKRQLAKFGLGDDEYPGIQGLHSSWVTDYLLGMQRLHQDTVPAVIEKFLAAGIRSVFNLTQPGEHPYCGHELLESSGFSYNPDDLMAKGITHFNYNWEDMTAPSMSMLLDIVQVALHEIKKGSKLALHCHAGYGRTGTVIACILIAKEGMDSLAAIKLVRAKRPGSIQKVSQERIIHAFEVTWREARCDFPAYTAASGAGSMLTPRGATVGGDRGAMLPALAGVSPSRGAKLALSKPVAGGTPPPHSHSFGPGTPESAPSTPARSGSWSGTKSPFSPPLAGGGGGTFLMSPSEGSELPSITTTTTTSGSSSPCSPSKSIAQSVRDARLFHTIDEISAYPENNLRFLAKSVVLCTQGLEGVIATKGKEGALAVASALSSGGSSGSAEESAVSTLVLEAKEGANRGAWDALEKAVHGAATVQAESEPCTRVLSLLLLDWLLSRADALLSGPTLGMLGLAMNAMESDNSGADGSAFVRDLLAAIGPTTMESATATTEASNAAKLTLQKPQIYLLDAIVCLLRAVAGALGVVVGPGMLEHEHGRAFLAAALRLALASTGHVDMMVNVDDTEPGLNSLAESRLFPSSSSDQQQEQGAANAGSSLAVAATAFLLRLMREGFAVSKPYQVKKE
jgi:hypothetical protein